MSERTYFSDSPGIYAKGRYVSIAADENSNVTERINDREHYQVFLDVNDRDNLPYPVSRVKLDSFWDTNDDDKDQEDNEKHLIVEASIDFDQGVFYDNNDTQPETLIEALGKDIREYSEQQITRLPHDPLSLYLIDGSTAIVRVAYGASLTESTISIQTYDISALDRLTIADLRLSTNITDAVPEALFKRTASTLAITLDTLHSNYNRDMIPRRHFNYEFNRPRETESQSVRSALGLTATKSIDIRINGAPDPSEFMISQNTKVFDAFGGIDAQKERLIELGDIFKGDELAARYGLKTRPILLYGPPGTGKTSLVKALADYTGARLESFRSKDIIDKMVGESPKYLANLFESIYKQPIRTIIFLDEIDALASKQALRASVIYAEVQRELQQQISEELPKHPHILLTAATTVDIDDISEPLTRGGRFESLYIGRPNFAQRTDIWCTILKQKQEEYDNSLQYRDSDNTKTQPIKAFDKYDIIKLSELTDELTGSDINVLIEDAVAICRRRYKASGRNQSVTNDILFQVIKEHRQHQA